MTEEKPAQNGASVSFSIDDSQTTKKRASVKRGQSKRNSLRSSFFQMRSMSFRRSGGNRGADINTLRGTHGPDFEGYAVINRSDEVGLPLCNCFGGGGKDMREKIILIKGPFCFVFNTESDPAPKYAIAAANMKPVLQAPSHGQSVVTIETALGDVEWELKFAQENIAKQFLDTFKQQAAVGEADEVRKRLGHEQLLNKRSSVKYAEKVANKKMEDQPEKQERFNMEELDRAEPALLPGI